MTCSLGDLRGAPQVPDACLPRCSRLTWDAVVACRTDTDPTTCQNTAIVADATPPVVFDLLTDAVDLTCGECLTRQTSACAFEVCPDESLEATRCATFRATSGCVAPNGSWTNCLSSKLTAFRACQAIADQRCVAP